MPEPPKSILLVDDEPGVAAALFVRLQAAGYQVFHALNGLAGIEAATLHRPDVIVLDVRMPDIEGFEVCQRLKVDPDLAHIPVIFLSANTQDTTRSRAMEAGGSLYLTKPYEHTEVIDAIEQVAAAGTRPARGASVAAAP